MDYYYLSVQDDVYGVSQSICSPMCSPQNVCTVPGALVGGCVHCPIQVPCVGFANHIE